MTVSHDRAVGCTRPAALLCLALALTPSPLSAQQQIVDPEFKVRVTAPAYGHGGPHVVIDEAHANFHTAEGRYKPFAQLLRSDGYRVTGSARKFAPGAFSGVDVLVVANANAHSYTEPAFTDAESDAVRDWVRTGGALLLIADHAPFGTSAANLAARFGVAMGKGWVFETSPTGITTQLVFSLENGRLGDHPILHGRSAFEQIAVVKSFTGQSLGVPPGASVLLALGRDAREAASTDDLNAEAAAHAPGAAAAPGSRSVAVAGRAQGVALTFGAGRVVVVGEAALFSAQFVTVPGPDGDIVFKAGMNAPGNDDRQFGLNVLHWLSGALQ